MATQITNRLKLIFTLLVVFASVVSVRADDIIPYEDDGNGIESETETVPEDEIDADESSEIDAEDLDAALETMEQAQPSSVVGRADVVTAGHYGERVDNPGIFMEIGTDRAAMPYFSNADIGMGDNLSDMTWNDAGFMARGMDVYLPQSIITNPNVAQLFRRHSSLRQSNGLELPSAFAPLITFVENYINTNQRDGAQATNGINNNRLAIHIVRASFCFGTDPFMIISKMRRETHFSRASTSPTGAVGFSQMTGAGIDEVEDQLSGDTSISVGNARSTFRQAMRCFTGISNLNALAGNNEAVKTRLQNSWSWDIMYGQIHMKTLVSRVKADNVADNATAYRRAFEMYNGQTNTVRGTCTQRNNVEMRVEYACDVLSHYNRLSQQWIRFVTRGNGRGNT